MKKLILLLCLYSISCIGQGNNKPCSNSCTTCNASLSCVSCVCSNSLPVTWGEFTLKQIDKIVEVRWVVLNEVNNDYFVIERLTTDYTFSEIGVYSGRGTVSTKRVYIFNDDFVEDGINYYRIKQVDFDGNYTYSETRSIKVDNSEDILEIIYYTLDGKQLESIPTQQGTYCYKVIYVSGKVKFKVFTIY